MIQRIGDFQNLLARLETWLARHRRRFLKGLCPGAGGAELAALEKQLGIAVPPELRLLLGWHDGQSDDFIGKFEENWQLMSATAIAAAKQELDAGTATTGWQKSWVPFLDNDAGDYVCLDTALVDVPVREFWLGKSDHPIVATSLYVWLQDFVDQVEQGKYREEPERGAFMLQKRGQDL
jgi:cell wall assembly regulator SMI1